MSDTLVHLIVIADTTFTSLAWRYGYSMVAIEVTNAFLM